MKDTFVFEGTFTYIVQADSIEEAEEMMQSEMGDTVFEYRVDRAYS